MEISPTLKDLDVAEMVGPVMSLIVQLALAESVWLSSGLAVFEGHSCGSLLCLEK